MKKSKKGKIICLSLLGAAIAGTVLFLIISGNTKVVDEKSSVKEREYTASVGDITVGIDAGGKLAAENVPLTFSDDTVIERVFVKAGDYVKKGDRLVGLGTSEAEKNHAKYEETYKSAGEKLKDLQDEKEEYILDLNWQLENEEDASADEYYTRVDNLNDDIYTLEDRLDEAQWRKDYLDDDTFMDATIATAEKELQAKKDELEKVKADREKQKELENDLVYQKERQENKLKEFDDKIAAAQQEQDFARIKMLEAESPFITANIDGVILTVNYSAGEAVVKNKPVVIMGDTTKMTLKMEIEPEDISDVQPEQEVEFYVDAYPDTVFKGKVSSKIMVPDTNGKYGAIVTVEENDRELLDGMAAGGTLIVKQKLDVLTLPNKTIELIDGKQYVKIRNSEGILENKEITTGFSDGRMTEILTGLKEGDVVIYEG